MSGETARQESGWTTDTLKQHYDRRFEDQDKAVQAALLAAKEAVTKAEMASEKRFDSVNEFRKTLSDQTSTFIPRLEYAAQHKSLEDKYAAQLKALEDKVSLLTDRMNQDKGGEINMGKIYAAIGTVGAVLAMIVLLANNVF